MIKISNSIAETKKIASEVVKNITEENVISLDGELGSGKTHFTKGVAEFLGVKREITSPTFVLMKVYKTKNKSFEKLVHIDAYRLSSANDLEALGVEEYFKDPKTLVVIEWADKIKKLLPKKRVAIFLETINEKQKKIKIA